MRRLPVITAIATSFAMASYVALFCYGLSLHQIEIKPSVLLKNILTFGFPPLEYVIIFMIIFLILSMYFLILMVKNKDKKDAFKNFYRSKSDAFGSADWLKDKKLNNVANLTTARNAANTIVGQMEKTGEVIEIKKDSNLNSHIAVYGPSGRGKSYSFAKPFIAQAVKRRESIIITDPSGEHYKSMSEYLREEGYTVKILNLANPRFSDGWDCLREIINKPDAATKFAHAIIANSSDPGSKDPFESSEESLLKALCLRIALGPDFTLGKDKNISTVYDYIVSGKETMGTAGGLFDSSVMPEETKISLQSYQIIADASPNAKSNIFANLGAKLGNLTDTSIKKLLSEDDINLTLPGLEPCAYFCVIPEEDRSMRFVSALFIDFLFLDLMDYAKNNNGKLKTKVNFLLDEFPNIGKLSDFSNRISTVRKYGIAISVLFTDIPRLQDMYPAEWKSILANCDTHICLGCGNGDMDTARYVSERSGETTIVTSTSRNQFLSPFPDSNSQGYGKRMLLTPHEVMTLEPRYSLVMFSGQNVLKSKTFDFQTHPAFEKISGNEVTLSNIPEIEDAKGRHEYRINEQARIHAYKKYVLKMSDAQIAAEEEQLLAMLNAQTPTSTYVRRDYAKVFTGDEEHAPVIDLKIDGEEANAPSVRKEEVSAPLQVPSDLANPSPKPDTKENPAFLQESDFTQYNFNFNFQNDASFGFTDDDDPNIDGTVKPPTQRKGTK